MQKMLASRYSRLALPFVLPLAFALWAESWEFAVVGVAVVSLLCWMMLWFRTWRTAIPGALMIDVLAWIAGAVLYLFTHAD
jgi:hypothetical protein